MCHPFFFPFSLIEKGEKDYKENWESVILRIGIRFFFSFHCNILFLFGCGLYITFTVFTMFIIFSINIYGIMDISINLDYRKYEIGIMVISINLDYRKYGIG
jgi:hypothetical protein